MFVPDHYVGFVPRPAWAGESARITKLVPSPDAFLHPVVLMAMIAERHRRVRIGTGVTEPFRHHPATLAQAFVTLDNLSRGRAILGIGSGERMNTEPYGIRFQKQVTRLEEALAIIRLLWGSGGEPVDFDGEIWRLRRAVFAAPLYQGRPPAIWVAAHGPRGLALTGRYGDGWYPGAKLSADEYRNSLAVIKAAGLKAGRDLSTFEAALQIIVIVGRDRKQALQAALNAGPTAAVAAMLLPGKIWRRHGLRHPCGEEFSGFPDFVPDTVTSDQINAARRQVTPDLLGEWAFAGSAAEIVAEVRPLISAGVRHLIMWNAGALAMGTNLAEFCRMALLIRRLKKLPVVDM